MTQTTHEVPVTVEHNESTIDVSLPVERRKVVYNPADVRTFTTSQMRQIEDDIMSLLDRSDIAPDDIQHMVADQLEQIGIVSLDGSAVVNLVDAEGKHDLRAIVTDYHDFGTRMRHADLIPQEAEDATNSEEDAEKTAQERREQEHMITAILEEAYSKVQRAESVVEQDAETWKRGHELVDATIQRVERLARQLMNGEPIQQFEARQLAEQDIPDMFRVLNREATDREDGRVAVNRLGNDVGELSSQNPNIDDDHRQELKTALRRVNGALEAMATNRTRLAGATDEAQRQASQIATVVSEMSYSHHGGEDYGYRLNQQINRLKELVSDSRMLSRQFPELISNVRHAFDK